MGGQPRPSLPAPCLCLVTDRKLCGETSLVELVTQAVDGGVQLVQLREKDMLGGALLKLALRLREVTRGQALFLVNERIDIALACGADGVHLGEEGLPVEVARALMGPSMLIGRSVHDLDGARKAEAAGADFLQVGAIFPTRSKPGAVPGGPGLVRQVKAAVKAPVVGIGGIDASNAGQIIQWRGDGVAVVSAILGVADPRTAAQALRRELERAWSQRRKRAVSPASPPRG